MVGYANIPETRITVSDAGFLVEKVSINAKDAQRFTVLSRTFCERFPFHLIPSSARVVIRAEIR